MTPSPNPVEPAVSSQEALRPRPGRAHLDEMAAIKAARPLHHGLAEPIAGRGRPWWCPGRLSRLLRALLRPESGSIVHVNGRRLAKPGFFYLQPLGLTYLGTKKPWNKVGSVIRQINETESCLLKSADRMGLQAHVGVVFSQFLSRETFFRFPFTFGVREIAV
jgi:hypothetical protein